MRIVEHFNNIKQKARYGNGINTSSSTTMVNNIITFKKCDDQFPIKEKVKQETRKEIVITQSLRIYLKKSQKQ